MTPNRWIKNTTSIAAIFSFRMLGLFMLIPVFTLYAHQLSGATPWLIGLTLGCYGFSQGLLQIPFGLLSDRYGRKPMLFIGLTLFASGSLIGACTHSIIGMMIARTLQGSGAIGSVLIALLADVTADQHRTKAMAIIGLTIGLSFALAMIISPLISTSFGLSGIFSVTTVLAVIGFFLVMTLPTLPPHQRQDAGIAQLRPALLNPHLRRINAGIFFQHLILTTTFFAVPTLLQPLLTSHTHAGWFYLPLMLVGFLFMIPLLFLAERKKQIKTIFSLSVVMIGLSQILLTIQNTSLHSIGISLMLYFIAFNTLESLLPSLASRQALAAYRGSAMGIYSSCQFLGIFIGGSVAGLLFTSWGYMGIFIFNILITLLWIWIAWSMQPLSYQYPITLSASFTAEHCERLHQALSILPGVKEISLDINKQQITLMVEKKNYVNQSAEMALKKLNGQFKD